uniref:Capsid protein n=1 Tax=Diporeia sp. associated circular virus TaxID=1299317 RepID=M1TG53_9VIRU|nr:hypothetical protein [Diporeia sp. associated circular virus]
MEENFPDENDKKDRSTPIHNRPFFQGPNSGQLNYRYCLKRPWEPYCDFRLRKTCYNRDGTLKGRCKKLEMPPFKRRKPGYPKKKPAYTKKRYAKKRYTKKRGFGKKRGSTRKSSEIDAFKAAPYYYEDVHYNTILTANQNTTTYSYGNNRMSLWTPYDLKTYCALQDASITANQVYKILLDKALIQIQLTNFDTNDVEIIPYQFWPKNDFYGNKSPAGIFVQGITDINEGVDASTYPQTLIHHSPMFMQQFKVSKGHVKVLKPGEHFTWTYRRNLQKVFNTAKLTSPGTTTFSPVVDEQWLKGITSHFGFRIRGSVHDVITAGTGGTTGVGYTNAKVGAIVYKCFGTKITSTTISENIRKFVSPSGLLGLAGTATGASNIINDETNNAYADYAGGVALGEA